MSNIRVEKSHALSPTEAKKRVEAIAPKLKSDYGVDLLWSGDRADLKGSGVKGSVDVQSNAVVVDVQLGLLLKPLAPKVKDGIQKTLDSAFA